jgi:hypothetical protein
MKTKEFNNKMSKVNDLNNKVNELLKQKDELLLSLTSSFKKNDIVTYLDKNNVQQKGKVLYNVGQKSLTVIQSDNTKVNVSLDRLVIA